MEFRVKYLQALELKSEGRLVVTDKMPFNFRYIPLICAAFPEAKIIHVRRDPAATCWSNYKQYFASSDLGYCYDLKDLTQFYNYYVNLMDHWNLDYNNRIYHLNYENLIEKQKGTTQKVIKYLDLNWENKCLKPEQNNKPVITASQNQIRKSVYKNSSNAWKKFEPFLKGAFDDLIV